jgi:hypothetical protein
LTNDSFSAKVRQEGKFLMKSLFSIFFILVSSLAQATPIQLALSPSSSEELLNVLVSSAPQPNEVHCTAFVDRPSSDEAARANPDNKIACETKNPDGFSSFSIGISKVDSWGTHLEKTSFSVDGPFAEFLFLKFAEKTKSLGDATPTHSRWSKILLCDPDGGTCATDYFLNATTGPDSPAQVVCSQNSDLIKPSTFPHSASEYPSYSAYIQAMVTTQIARGDRTVRFTRCSFLK